MADPHLKSTLERKVLEIEGHLEEYRRIISEAQADLVHLRGTISLFERDRVHRVSSPVVSLAGVFRRGEAFEICRRALESAPDGLDTSELADACLRTKGMDTTDKLLRQSMRQSLAQMLHIRRDSGHVTSPRKRGHTCVWLLAVGSGE